MILQEKGASINHLGVYLHVPFCLDTCDFCAFYQEKPIGGVIKDYLDCLKREASCYRPNKMADTFFWGGGTPSILNPREMEITGKSLLEQFGQPEEWTVEVAPMLASEERIKMLLDIGVTRFSMGIQSFDDDLLHKLGRTHRLKHIYRSYETMRCLGCHNINFDLMFSLPGQSVERLLSDLKQAIELGPEHISTYCLTFEEDSALFIKLCQGKVKKDQEQEIQHYEKVWDYLESNGFHHYEISNFCKKGFACQHNINTWQMNEWIGIGPAASSQYHRQRYTNIPDTQSWIKGIRNNNPARIEIQSLDDHTLLQDMFIFGLRMTDGISKKLLSKRFPAISWNNINTFCQKLESEGLLEQNEKYIRLTRKGLMLADSVAVEVLMTL